MVEGPGILNKEASAAYHNLSRLEKEQLRHQVEQVLSEEKRMTKKDVIRRGEKIFVKIQKLVHKITTNNVHECMRFYIGNVVITGTHRTFSHYVYWRTQNLFPLCVLEHSEPFPTMCTGAPRTFSH